MLMIWRFAELKPPMRYFTNQAQRRNRKKNPVHVAYKALNAAGCSSNDATEVVQMFEIAYRLQDWL